MPSSRQLATPGARPGPGGATSRRAGRRRRDDRGALRRASQPILPAPPRSCQARRRSRGAAAGGSPVRSRVVRRPLGGISTRLSSLRSRARRKASFAASDTCSRVCRIYPFLRKDGTQAQSGAARAHRRGDPCLISAISDVATATARCWTTSTACAERLGRSPTMREFASDPETTVHPQTIVDRFGTWNAAKYAAPASYRGDSPPVRSS